MASWGSMRRSVMRWSSVSVSEPPRLQHVLATSTLAQGRRVGARRIPASAVELIVLGVVGGHGGGMRWAGGLAMVTFGGGEARAGGGSGGC